MNKEVQEPRAQTTATVIDLKPPPAEKVTVEKLQGRNGSMKRTKSPITATSYTVAALQTATNSFTQENLIGEGSLGRVYRAEFPNGKVISCSQEILIFLFQYKLSFICTFFQNYLSLSTRCCIFYINWLLL